jgi:chromosomal replication initiator protein
MNRLWQETLTQLEQTLSPQHFATWIKPIRFVGVEKDLVRLEVPNRFVLDWIREHYGQIIREALSRIGAVEYRIVLEISTRKGIKGVPKNEPSPAEADPPSQEKVRTPSSREWNSSFNLNPRYTFGEFVSGSSNQFAYAAAMAVANNPATTYNPLFIYGGVGLGKTHLINAVGNFILQNSPNIMPSTSPTSKLSLPRTNFQRKSLAWRKGSGPVSNGD